MDANQPNEIRRTWRGGRPRWASLLIVALLAWIGWQNGGLDLQALLDTLNDRAPLPVEKVPPTEDESSTQELGETTLAPSSGPLEQSVAQEPAPVSTNRTVVVVRNVVVKDLSGRVVLRGEVDLTETLDRIARGERHSHRNDGGVFRNLEGRLPRQPPGYYHEYVHPTPRIDGPGPQRIVVGRGGDIYYSHDHYRTFQKILP